MVPRERKKDVGCHLAQVLFAMKGSIHTAAKHISHNAQPAGKQSEACQLPWISKSTRYHMLPTNCRNVKKIPSVSTVGSGSNSRPGGEQEILLSKAVCKNPRVLTPFRLHGRFGELSLTEDSSQDTAHPIKQICARTTQA